VDLQNNIPLMCALAALIVAQFLKVVVVLVIDKKIEMFRLSSTGGMPSSHSSTVAALTTSMGYIYGIESPYFAIAAVFGMIVIYDSIGIRRAAGKHAEILNNLMQEFSHLWDEGEHPKALKTLLGHTYPQTIMGTILGILIGITGSRL
jgi:acid phosphatase family membrane protein YuiD